MAIIYLSHSPAALASYYGEEAVAGLRAVGEVRLNPSDHALTTAELIDAARDCTLMITYRQTPGEAELFRNLPDLVAFSRCAIDIRNVDVAAASANGILVTQASAGFIASVAEWIVGAMVDLGRGLSASTSAYHAGRPPAIAMGRQLRGSTLGVIGYGQISRYLCDVCLPLGMRILVSDPFAAVASPNITQVSLPQLLGESDFVVCLAIANEATENLIDERGFARMKPGAFFINASRGNLVDEAALLRALDGTLLAGCAIDVGRAPDQMPSLAIACHPKVIATPHIGGLTPQAIAHQALETVAQAATLLAGGIPIGAVNADSVAIEARARRLARMTAR